MSKFLKLKLARLMNEAGEGNDLPGDTSVLDDDYTPGTPEDRGDFLPGDNLDPDALNAVAKGADEDDAQANAAQEAADQKAREAEEAAEEEARANSGAVPHARFHEVNEKRKVAEQQRLAAEQENERLRAELEAARAGSPAKKSDPAQDQQGQAAPDFDVKAQEKAYVEALIGGDEDKAQEIRQTINEHILEQATSRAVKQVQAEQQARERQMAEQTAGQLLQATATAVVADYPFLNEEAHSEVLDMIEARRDALIAKGAPAHDALRQAADFIAPKFAPEGFAPAKSSVNATAKTDLREAAATARGAKASLAQPPVHAAGLGDRATGADPLNVAAMSDEQFERLSEADKKKLRGD